jgi:uncharacterized protein (DUF934 family)
MARIIKNTSIVEDGWNVFQLTEGQSAATVALPDEDGTTLFPLAVWQARKQEIIARSKRFGVWLDSNEKAEAIADDLHYFALVAINFPKFTDGRGYSIARLLRERHGYQGELRAVGDVLQDQLFFMKRCGFDAFVIRADRSVDAALKSLNDFPEVYQTAVDQPLPLFKRRQA